MKLLSILNKMMIRSMKFLLLAVALISLGTTASSSNATTVSVYDFDSLTGSVSPGTLISGTDNWVSVAGDIRARNDLSFLPGFSGNVTYSLGSSQLSRKNDVNFSFGVVGGTFLALEMTVQGDRSGNSFAHFAIGFDDNHNGILEFIESGPALGFLDGYFFVREARVGTQLKATTKSINSNGQVWRARLEIDLSANDGDGSGSLFARRLWDGSTDVSGSTVFAPLDGLQDINLKISNMEGASSTPANWDTLLIRGNGGTSLDDVTVETVPEPSTIAITVMGVAGLLMRRRVRHK